MTKKRTVIAIVAGALTVGLAVQAPADEKIDYKGMTSNVLMQIGGAPKEKAAAPKEGPNAFVERITEIVHRAQAEGRSDAYISDLISEIARGGDVEIPAALRTPGGELDTATLLSMIVSKAKTKDDPYASALLDEAKGKAGTIEANTETLVHVVEVGDSLAALALRYYSDAEAYTRILEANSDQIVRADLILVGQKLIIPR